MADTGDRGRKEILKDLITHMNVVEKKIKDLREDISQIRDAELLNKLDLMNLSDKVERIKLSVPDISPETKEELEEISDLVKKMEEMKDLHQELEEIEKTLAEEREKAEEKKKKGKKKKKQKKKPGKEEVKFCGKCGAEVIPEAKFCGNCGAELKLE